MDIKEKFIKKLDEIITNGIVSHEKSAYLPGFHIQREERDDYIYFIFNSSQNKNDISKESFIDEYKSILFDKKNIKVHISGSIKDKSIVSFLLKEKPDEILMKTIIDTFLDNPYKDNYQEIFRWCAQRPDKSYSQKIVFNILDNFKHKIVPKFHKNFESSISLLSHFDYKAKDYPLIHNFLTYSKDEIIRFENNEKHLMDFFKKKIKPQDWSEFSQYVKGEIGFVETDDPLLEEKELPVLNIVLSHSAIKNKYPNVSFDGDIEDMLFDVMYEINRNKEVLNLSKCFSSGKFEDNRNTSYFHFIGNSDTEHPDNKKIKTIFSCLIYLYAQNFTGRKSVTEEMMQRAFSFASISASNEAEVKEEKILKRKI